jgi:hypothetical protein
MSDNPEIVVLEEKTENVPGQEIPENNQKPRLPAERETGLRRANYFKSQDVREASPEELKKVEGKVLGRRLKETKVQIRRAYALIDKLLPESIGAVEKILKAEMDKRKGRDGYLVLSIAKYLGSKRLPDVGKIEPTGDNLEVELNLPTKKPKPEAQVNVLQGTDTKGNFMRVQSNRPVDLNIRQAVPTNAGVEVELVDCTEDTLVGALSDED